MSRLGTKPTPPNAGEVFRKLRAREYANRSVAQGQVTRALKGALKPGVKRNLERTLKEFYPPISPVVQDAIKERDAAHKEIAEVSEQLEEDVSEQMDYDTLLAHYKHEKARAEVAMSVVHNMRSELTDVKRTLSRIEGIDLFSTAPTMARAVAERLQPKAPSKQQVMVTVSGPSSSGKSTLIQLIQHALQMYNIGYTTTGTDTDHLAAAHLQQRRLMALSGNTHVTLVEQPTNNCPGFKEATARAIRVPGGAGW